MEGLDLKNYVLLHNDVKEFSESVDVVIQNPPFGVQEVHADRMFLIKAMENSKKIYSFHKIESQRFIEALADEYNFVLEEVLKFKFPLKKTQKFHTKNVHKVEVGCFILNKKV